MSKLAYGVYATHTDPEDTASFNRVGHRATLAGATSVAAEVLGRPVRSLKQVSSSRWEIWREGDEPVVRIEKGHYSADPAPFELRGKLHTRGLSPSTVRGQSMMSRCRRYLESRYDEMVAAGMRPGVDKKAYVAINMKACMRNMRERDKNPERYDSACGHSSMKGFSPRGNRKSAQAYDFLRWMSGWTITSDGPATLIAHRMGAVQGEKDGPSVEFFRMGPRQWSATYEGRKGFGTTPGAAVEKVGIPMFSGRFAHSVRRGIIGPRGIEPATAMHVEPHRIYALGASSSPKLVYINEVTPSHIYYTFYPFHGKKHSIEPWIGQDLIAKGTRQYVATYGDRPSPLINSMKDCLAGGKGEKANIKNFEPWVVVVTATKMNIGSDKWYVAERYGNVSGQSGKGNRYFYTIDTNWESLQKLRRDPQFRIIRAHKRALREHEASPLGALRSAARAVLHPFKTVGRALGLRKSRSPSGIDGGLIRRALRDVHLSEKSSTNPKGYERTQAAAHAIANHGLNSEEVDILLNGLAIRPDEKDAIIARAKKLRFGKSPTSTALGLRKSPSHKHRYMVVFDWAGVKGNRAVGRATLHEAKETAELAHLKGRKGVYIFDNHTNKRVALSPVYVTDGYGALHPSTAIGRERMKHLRRFTRAELIAALGLEAEGKSRGQKYNFSTDGYRKRIAYYNAPVDIEARRKLAIA